MCVVDQFLPNMFTLCGSRLAIVCLCCMAESPFSVATAALQVPILAGCVTCEVADCSYAYRHMGRKLEILTTLRQMALCQSQR